MSDAKLMIVFAILHVAALAAGGALLLLALSGGDGYANPHREGGAGGDEPPDAPRRPTGGPPLPVAKPARVRLREPAHLADLLPPPRRRAPRERKRRAPRPTNPRSAASVAMVGH
jgi:hypothetical protein